MSFPAGFAIAPTVIAVNPPESVEIISQGDLYLSALKTLPRPPEPRKHRVLTVLTGCPLVDQCVYYVVNRTGIQIRGNANTWLSVASDYGYGVYEEPRVLGAVVIATANPYGHIAVVEEIGDGWIRISEQNFEFCGDITERIIDIDDEQIIAYIY